MDDFFDDTPPEPPDEPRYRSPAWTGPPHGVLGCVLSTALDLGTTATAAVTLSHLEVYPSGAMLHLGAVVADGLDQRDGLLFGPHAPARSVPGQPARGLRFGVQYADGSKATADDARSLDPGANPGSPLLFPRSGGGGDGRYRHELWLWPLPPLGPVTFVCEWREAGLPLTRASIDAQAIQDAASRARIVFADERPEPPPPGERGGWTSYC